MFLTKIYILTDRTIIFYIIFVIFIYNCRMKLILASASPRRKEILSKAGYNFEVIPSDYDEKICGLNYSKELVENCAYNKALDVFKKVKGDYIIISADTVVVLNNKILGKPKDYDEAFNMLKELSDKTHFVATSVCLISSNNKILKDTELTYVTFRKLLDEEIENYLYTGKPYDKAGSYGIQDDNFDFAIKINGEIDNVIGFPYKLFKKMLDKISN